MFILDGKPLSPDVAFTYKGVQYPANWLRLSTQLDRDRLGITEVPDPEPYDERFYWQPNLPKDHAELVEQWVVQTRATANTLLAPTDWMVIREADNGTPCPVNTKIWRESVRTATSTKCDAIRATADTPALAAYITGAQYPVWPVEQEPAAPTTLEQIVADGSTVDQVFG